MSTHRTCPLTLFRQNKNLSVESYLVLVRKHEVSCGGSLCLTLEGLAKQFITPRVDVWCLL